MLPRSLFLIIVVGCWIQINAVPFHSRDDYQEDGNVMDYAFTANDGTNDKVSILENIKDTMETMDQLGVFKDKENVNVNANTPRHKKNGKKNKSHSLKRKKTTPILPIDSGNDHQNFDEQKNDINVNNKMENEMSNMKNDEISRRSAQQLPIEIENKFGIINEYKGELNRRKLRNYCTEVRRSNMENFSQSSDINSSYLDINEDFTAKGKAKMSTTHTVFTDQYVTICWIETVTTKEDKSHNPPKRLILRESTITFENTDGIPNEYLECPMIHGDITMESDDAICNTSFTDGIADDTHASRIINVTTHSREKNIDVHVNKIIKCIMGSVMTKDIYHWLNKTESSRQRVELKVSPLTFKTDEFCSNRNHNNYDASMNNNSSIECSDEMEQDVSIDENELSKNMTACSNANCTNKNTIDATIRPSTIFESLINEPRLITKIDDVLTTVTPSIISGLNSILTTVRPSDNNSEINDILSTGFTRRAFATQSPIGQDINLSQDNLCIGANCTEINSVTIPSINIPTSSEDISCNGANCKNTASINEHDTIESIEKNGKIKDNISISDDIVEKDRKELYIPKPFICPVKNEKLCAHLERVAELQAQESSSEEDVEESKENSAGANETSSSEEEVSKNYNVNGNGNLMSTVPIISVDSLNKYTTSNVSTLLSTGQPVLSVEHDDTSKYQLINKKNESEELSLSSESDEIFINHTQEIIDGSTSEESKMKSVEDNTSIQYLNHTELYESCEDSEKCHGMNVTSISRIPSPTTPTSIKIMPSGTNENEIKIQDKKVEEEDSGSCDCDEESEESKKCDSSTGLCPPVTHNLHDDKIYTESIDELKRETISSEKEKDNDDKKKTLSNHKLSLKIHVSLEHIDENDENHELAQVEKNITLNELPDEHGNHSLYWKIKALNTSGNNINSLKNIFNCSILEKLTEDAIIEKLNMTYLNHKKSNINNDLNHSRNRRNVENITISNNNTRHNESLMNGLVIKECILPNIREDVRNGLNDMLMNLSNVLNSSRNSPIQRFDMNTTEVTTTTIRNDVNTTTESLNNSTMTNRNKRSSMSNNVDVDIEEVSRWSKERFTPSTDGGQLRSFTELKIFQNSK